MWRRNAPVDMSAAAVFLLAGMFTYSAWLTSIVFCSANDERPLPLSFQSAWSTALASGSAVGDAGRHYSRFSRAGCRHAECQANSLRPEECATAGDAAQFQFCCRTSGVGPLAPQCGEELVCNVQ